MMMVARLLATLGQIYYIFRGQPSEKFVGCQTVLVTVLRILKSNISQWHLFERGLPIPSDYLLEGTDYPLEQFAEGIG
jgi:hypothetical protein